jgi:hypothetical protein
VNEKRDDVRATAEDLIADAERLKQIEKAKLEPGLSDDEADRLSEEGAEVTRQMRTKALMQQELSDPTD